MLALVRNTSEEPNSMIPTIAIDFCIEIEKICSLSRSIVHGIYVHFTLC